MRAFRRDQEFVAQGSPALLFFRNECFLGILARNEIADCKMIRRLRGPCSGFPVRNIWLSHLQGASNILLSPSVMTPNLLQLAAAHRFQRKKWSCLHLILLNITLSLKAQRLFPLLRTWPQRSWEIQGGVVLCQRRGRERRLRY